MARYYGCSQPRISREVVARGLDPRLPQAGRKAMTLGQFLETEIARAMARSAAETGAALRDSEMVDAPNRIWGRAA